MNTHAIVVEYDPAWPQMFAKLAAVLASTLGIMACAIHHVGSTAIPGMLAKPILDIDIELVSHVSVVVVSEVLATLGYQSKGEQGVPDRFAYRRESPAVPFSTKCSVWPQHHLYVCPYGSRELARHLLFRDKLRCSEALRQQYIQIKCEALLRANGVRQVYVDEKQRLGSDFFRQVLDEL